MFLDLLLCMPCFGIRRHVFTTSINLGWTELSGSSQKKTYTAVRTPAHTPPQGLLDFARFPSPQGHELFLAAYLGFVAGRVVGSLPVGIYSSEG